MNFKSVKIQLSVFLALFALYLSFINKDTLFLSGLGISLIAAISADSFITYVKTKKTIITESSVVSGLIIGYVISTDQPWWLIALTSIMAIASKHLIRFKARHIFNPAGFGILIAAFLLGVSTEWKGAYLWYIIIPFGIYFVFKIKRQEIIASYFISSFLLFGCQAIAHRVNIFNIFEYLNYFFIFIMLIEPMTTPVKPAGKIFFGTGVAILIFIFYTIGVKEAEILSLLCLNLLSQRRG